MENWEDLRFTHNRVKSTASFTSIDRLIRRGNDLPGLLAETNVGHGRPDEFFRTANVQTVDTNFITNDSGFVTIEQPSGSGLK